MTVGHSLGLDSLDLLQDLGRGAMAEVFLARLRDDETLVALKALRGFATGGPEVVAQVLARAEAAGRLRHRNAVLVHGAFVQDGVPYVVSDLVQGGALAPLLGAPWQLAPLAAVLQEVLGALGAAEARGLTHGDLNPKNILLTATGHVRVSDFGLATVQWADEDAAGPALTVGTPAYMSPEQALGNELTPASDLYAVGCVAYELLTGRVPFRGEDQMAVLRAHVQEPVPDPREAEPGVPRSLVRWVARMTAKAPEARFPDAAAALDELQEAVVGQLGTLWEQDAGVAPEATLELDDLEDETPRSLQEAGERRTTRSGGAGAGFETYRAPVTLHEQQRELRGQQAAAEAEAARREAEAEAARRALEPEPEELDELEEEATDDEVAEEPEEARPAPRVAPAAEEPPKPLWPVFALAVVGLIAAFAAAFAAGGPDTPISARSDGLTLRAPTGWRAVPARDVVSAFGRRAVALAPPGALPGEGVIAARVEPDGPTLLPARLAAGVQGAAVATQLRAGQALRRTVALGPRRLTTYALATDTGGVVLACTGSVPVQKVCGDVAGSFAIAGKVRDLGATDEGAQALSGALNRLRDDARNPADDIARATTREQQALDASDLASAYSRAASAVTRADLGVRAGPAQTRLGGALGAVAVGWRSFASSARRGEDGAVASARQAIRAGVLRAAAARDELSELGYTRS